MITTHVVKTSEIQLESSIQIREGNVYSQEHLTMIRKIRPIQKLSTFIFSIRTWKI